MLICYNLFELQKKESDSKKLEKKYIAHFYHLEKNVLDMLKKRI